MVSKCTLCGWFAAKSLKGVLRHMGTVHAHEAGFYVRCDVHGCPRTYQNFHSYKKHLYTKHREVLDISSSELDIEEDGARSSGGNSTPSPCPSEPEPDDDRCTSRKKQMREAALFVLKAKHVHKVAQSSLNGVMCDITTMLESTVHRLEKGVMAALGNADAALKMHVNEIFHSQEVSDPFCGLTSEYTQKTFFREEFHLVVGLLHVAHL